MPTRRCLRAIAVLLLVALAVPLVSWLTVPLQIGGALLVVLAVLDLVTVPRRELLRVWRELPPHAQVGRRAVARVHVANAGRRSVEIELRDVLPAALDGVPLHTSAVLAPGAELSWAVPFVPLERGEHRFGPIGLRVGRVGALLHLQQAVAEGDVQVALPGRPSGEVAWLLSRATLAAEPGGRRVPRLGGEWEFESLREYVIGDEPRRIDWKSSARRGRPYVRQYQIERQTELVLALDCGRLMGTRIDGVTKLDLAMTPLLDVAAVALSRGERVGLLAFDSRPRSFLPARGGLVQLQAITAELARLPSPDEPTSYLRAVAHLQARHRRRALVLVFTDFTDEISALDVHKSLAVLAQRHVLVFVGVADPHLEAAFLERTSDPAALFEKAVAGELLAERRRVLHGMEKLGVFTVDAEPRRLSAPLLSRYLEVRLHGVL